MLGAALSRSRLKVTTSLLTAHCPLLTAHCSLPTVHCSLLRRVIAFAGAHLRVLHPAKLHRDFSESPVASFVRWIVTEAVLRADLVGHLRERGACILQSGR